MRASLAISFLIYELIILNVDGFFDTSFGRESIIRSKYRRACNPQNVEEKWIYQLVDNYDLNKKEVWEMRYFENIEFWKPNGPIYILIGGEGEADPRFISCGLVKDLAKETHGALFASEHRYYGKSIPLKYENVQNFQYLSSKQALADLATLIFYLKSLPQYKSSKVVVVGGSYAGNLATWMRLKYPNLVDAAIASSAPVLAKVDFFEYFETVADGFKRFGLKGCYETIENIFHRYTQLLSSNYGIFQLKRELNVCQYSDLTKKDNVAYLIFVVLGNFAMAAQYGGIREFERMCQHIMYTRGTINYNYLLQYTQNKNGCFDADFNKLRKPGSPWVYQICNEFSYAQTTSSNHQPFTKYTVDTFYRLCTQMFGEKFNENSIIRAVSETNEFYGGLTPNVTNVLFINGDIDPWHRLGITKDLSDVALARMIPRSTHCADLLPEHETDSHELREMRAFEKQTIKQWLGI